MKTFRPDLPISVTFHLAGQVADTEASLRWRSTDEAEMVVTPWADVGYDDADSDAGRVTLSLDDSQTGLATDALRGLRIFELEVGGQLFTEVVVIEDASLHFGVNTFCTYGEAMLLSHDFNTSVMPGWFGGTRNDQEQALKTAYDRVMQLPLRVQWGDAQNRLTTDSFVQPSRLIVRDMTPDELAQLDSRMMTALKKAQLVEADEVLSGDPTRAAVMNNLSSLTVGESSQSAMPGRVRPIEHPVCARALAYLARWINLSVRLHRG